MRIRLCWRDWFRAMLCMIIGVLTGCTPAYNPNGYPSPTGMGSPTTPVLTPWDRTVDLENLDRIARFQRLANIGGIIPPTITQTVVTPEQVPGIERPIPVVRIVFDERVLFDFDKDVPRPEAAAVLDLVADNMRRDVPDAQLTLLGHTDAVGSDQYNYDLSTRRARNVFQALVNRGVNPAQLSTVAIGKNQPIASNETEQGRARNRRVEFLISASRGANLAVVRLQPINPAYLRVDPTDARPVEPVAGGVPVLGPAPETYNGPADVSEAEPHGKVSLRPLGNIPLQGASPSAAAVRVSAPPPPVRAQPAPESPPVLQQPTPVERAPLGPSVTY